MRRVTGPMISFILFAIVVTLFGGRMPLMRTHPTFATLVMIVTYFLLVATIVGVNTPGTAGRRLTFFSFAAMISTIAIEYF